jgi:hypothetical protein
MPNQRPEHSDLTWNERLSLVDEKCRGITLRQLPESARPQKSSFGKTRRIRIAVDPPEIDALLGPKRIEECPVCANVVGPADRVAASLEVDFAKGAVIQSVWVHQKCLDRCTDTGEQRGSPV